MRYIWVKLVSAVCVRFDTVVTVASIGAKYSHHKSETGKRDLRHMKALKMHEALLLAKKVVILELVNNPKFPFADTQCELVAGVDKSALRSWNPKKSTD